jgi:uncharacterized protein (UPF0332 family)
MGRIDNALKWCLEKGKKGEKKHTGLIKIDPNDLESANQLKKAKSDLETMRYLYNGNRTDWVASAAFYAMYHSLMAVLYKLGYESRNQECTIIAIETFIQGGAIKLEQKYIDMIRSLQDDEDARSIREEMQYGSQTVMEKKRCEVLMNQAEEFVERLRRVLGEI